MARHFAKVVTSPVGIGTTTVVNKVTTVIVAEPDFFNSYVDNTPGRWIETFKGMFGGVLYDSDGTQASDQSGVGTMRYNFAGIGYEYDINNDVFHDEQPHESWTIDKTTYTWKPPVPKPDARSWAWNETIYQNAVGAGTSTGAAWIFVDN